MSLIFTTMKNETSTKKKDFILYIILPFLIITNAITLWLFFRERDTAFDQRIKTEMLIIHQNSLVSDLLVLQKKYKNLASNYVQVQKEMASKKARIDSLLSELAKHKGDDRMLNKLKLELEGYRTTIHDVDF